MRPTDEDFRHSGRERRRFLAMLAGFGGAALGLPLLPGCAPEEAEPPPTSDPDPRDEGTDEPVPPGQPASELGQRPEQAGGPDADAVERAMLPRLDESDTMAQALGYKHDAARVDPKQFPSRAQPGGANEFCRNCVHYQGSADQPWAPCTIFPGKLVSAGGWCSAWAAS
jgi:hypothetical protein